MLNCFCDIKIFALNTYCKCIRINCDKIDLNLYLIAFPCINPCTPFFINNQKFKQLPRKFVKQFLNNLPGQTRDETQTIPCENRLKPFFCIGSLREMLTFGLVSSKVCTTYSRSPCNKLWRRSESLHI